MKVTVTMTRKELIKDFKAMINGGYSLDDKERKLLASIDKMSNKVLLSKYRAMVTKNYAHHEDPVSILEAILDADTPVKRLKLEVKR